MFRSSCRRSNFRRLPPSHPISTCSQRVTQPPRLPLVALTWVALPLVGVWMTGCSRPTDPNVDAKRSGGSAVPTAKTSSDEEPAGHVAPSPTEEPRSLTDELSRSPTSADEEAERATEEILAPLDESDEFRPDRRAAEAFGDPPGAVRLSRQSRLWVDRANARVLTDGYVTLREGYLEMFACPSGTKEHESIVATLSKSREVHAGLLAVGATQGHPVRYDPEFEPPSGQSIRIWVLWRDEAGDFHTVDARNWVRHAKSKDPLSEDWV